MALKGTPVVRVAWVCGYAQEPGQMTIQGERSDALASGSLSIRLRTGECRCVAGSEVGEKDIN